MSPSTRLAALLLLTACGPARITPRLANDHDVVTRDGVTAPDPDQPPVRAGGPPAGDNVYTCSCTIRLPAACLPEWCGQFETGTQILPDGTCDLGLRDAHVCFPAALNPRSAAAPATAHWPSYDELVADCAQRVSAVVGPGARRVFALGCGGAYGVEPCEIRWGCSALRVDGTVATGHDDACDQRCPAVDLTELTPGHWNFDQATYLSELNQWLCHGATVTPDTPIVCHR